LILEIILSSGLRFRIDGMDQTEYARRLHGRNLPSTSVDFAAVPHDNGSVSFFLEGGHQ
jgi:hypothetical protein